jgi:hypothetical protein
MGMVRPHCLVAILGCAALVILASPAGSEERDPYLSKLNAIDDAATEVGCADCPPESPQIENEPVCAEDYVDLFNGGCNSTPPVFNRIENCWLCGKTGGFLDNGVSVRDTDWYTFEATRPGRLAGLAAVPLLLSMQDRGCPSTIIATATAPTCMPTPVVDFEPGSYVLMATVDGVGPQLPCGSEYVIAIQGLDVPCGKSPVEATTWGGIKAVYGR